MPRFRTAANANLEVFVQALVDELQANAQPLPGNPLEQSGERPVIFETPTGLGDRFRVTVAWDQWKELAVEDRNKIIMEAYRRVLTSDSVNVSLALGLTRDQYDKMTISIGG